MVTPELETAETKPCHNSRGVHSLGLSPAALATSGTNAGRWLFECRSLPGAEHQARLIPAFDAQCGGDSFEDTNGGEVCHELGVTPAGPFASR